MLNPRDEKACLNIAKGMNKTESLSDAGFDSKWIATHTTRWLKRANIQARLTELQALVTTPAVASLQEKHEVLTKIIREQVKQPVTAKEQVMAIAESNRMTGDYAPEKHLVASKVIFEVVYRREDAIQEQRDEVPATE